MIRTDQQEVNLVVNPTIRQVRVESLVIVHATITTVPLNQAGSESAGALAMAEAAAYHIDIQSLGTRITGDRSLYITFSP